jgi:DNA polymerase
VAHPAALEAAFLQQPLDVSATVDGVTGDKLRKDEVFAQLLRDQGIDPAMKPGKPKPDGTAKWNYAFAKTDDFMRDLLEADDEVVVTLAEARISEKSNGMQTRSERLGWMSTRGAMCVYLNYAGAHTSRFSGGDKVNWQNLKRGGPIQGAIEAPPGKKVITRDASQIECRVLNMVAGQMDVIERFRNHEDPYTGIASKFYGHEVYKAKAGDPREQEMETKRGTGKQLELSCGYGAGGPTIKTTAKKGTYGPPVFLTDDQALQARDLYRQTHPAVTGYWRQADDVLKKINANMTFEWGPLYIANKRIYLPNGFPLIYETLEWHVAEDGDSYWRIATRHGRAKLYGAKLVENVIQALARLHTTQAWLRCVRAGIPMKSMEHDKLIALVHEHEAEAAYEYMGVEMSRAPEWLPGIPLDSEGYISNTFAKPERTQ